MSQALATSNLIELRAAHFYLRQLQQFLGDVDDQQYGLPVPALGGSIGAHTRHVIEHFQGILAARTCGSLCFEDRTRDPGLQGQRSLALERLRSLQAEVEDWAQAYEAPGIREGVLPCLQAKVLARTSLTGDLHERVEIDSTFAREWTYVILHSVHHLALIAAAARLLGIPVDAALGRAPATLYFEGHPVNYLE